MAVDDEKTKVLGEANRLSDELWALATEYQEVVPPGRGRRASDKSKEPKRRLDRTILARLYRTLQPQPVIDSLRQRGLTEIADRLDELWKATAMVFSHVDTSDGVETTAIDVQILHKAVEQAEWDFDTRDWTRGDHIGNLRGIDNAGLLDEIDDSLLNNLSDNEFRTLYNVIEDFSADRAIAWQNEGDSPATLLETGALSRLMYRAGEPPATIAETLRARLGSSQTKIGRAHV